MAETAVEPILDGRPLGQGLTPAETTALNHLVERAVGDHHVLRLRLRDLPGHVVYSDDGSGFKEKPEDAGPRRRPRRHLRRSHPPQRRRQRHRARRPPSGRGLPAAHGRARPNTSSGCSRCTCPTRPSPLDVNAGLHTLYRDLLLGLGALYVALFVISVSVSRRLRQQVKENKFLAEHDPLTDLPNRSLFHQRAR